MDTRWIMHDVLNSKLLSLQIVISSQLAMQIYFLVLQFSSTNYFWHKPYDLLWSLSSTLAVDTKKDRHENQNMFGAELKPGSLLVTRPDPNIGDPVRNLDLFIWSSPELLETRS